MHINPSSTYLSYSTYKMESCFSGNYWVMLTMILKNSREENHKHSPKEENFRRPNNKKGNFGIQLHIDVSKSPIYL